MNNYKQNLLNEASAFDGLIAFKFIDLLVKPFNEWPAFKLGIIDEDGNRLKKPKSSEEKKEYGIFQRLVKNMKKMITKFPGGKLKIASYAAALFLLKEEYDLDDATVNKLTETLITRMEELGYEVEYPNELVEAEYRVTRGRYELDSGEIVIVHGEMFPETRFLGVELYKSLNNTTGKDIIFAYENVMEQF